MRTKRTKAELLQLLADQRAALAASCQSYDKGNEWEAARIANSIFTLVHDGGSIISILSQLGIRGSLRFISSGHGDEPNNAMAGIPLVGFSLQRDGGSKTVPLCALGLERDRKAQFPNWWAKELIYQDDQFQLTRRRLVFSLRHQDGGSHVGELTDEAYIRLKTKEIGFVRFNDEPMVAMYALTATMRQIAWEVTKTLDDYGSIQ